MGIDDFVSGAGVFEGRGLSSDFGIGFAFGAGGGGGGSGGGIFVFRPEGPDDPPISFPTVPLGVSGFAFGGGGRVFDGFGASPLPLLALPLRSRQGGVGDGSFLSGDDDRLGFPYLLPYS